MENQDMPVNPTIISETFTFVGGKSKTVDVEYLGETKREKAFWQVFSAMLDSNPCTEYDAIAYSAIKAVNAGFKALESDNE